MMTLIHAYKDRGLTREITIQDAVGNTIIPGGLDEIRAIIGREGEAAKLTVASNAPTANGSTFTKAAANILRLDASDLVLIDAGIYTLYIDFFDESDSEEWKNVEREIFSLEET